MRILFITTSHNSMSQRAYVELTDLGHEVVIQLADSKENMIGAVQQHQPELILAPFLKTAIPEEIWQTRTCLIVHPGIMGDRGPSSLDRAIMDEQEEWGVTVLQADSQMDAGDIWATATFPMPAVSKSQLYRHEVTQAAMTVMLEAVAKFEAGDFSPEPLDYADPRVKGKLHTPIKQAERHIDWYEPTASIVKKIRAADSSPGVLDTGLGEELYLYDAHEEDRLQGNPGEILAQRGSAICVGTGDGAVWIGHVKRRGQFKLPATVALQERLAGISEAELSPFAACEGRTYREIFYTEKNAVGYLHFPFYNGAMSTEQCEALRATVVEAKKRDTRVLVLLGGTDVWSNGIHLNRIEHADDPADESWHNINAMNDLVREILLTDTKVTISALQGNAGAGGVILALPADQVWARNGVVLNPHYQKMGGLYGSEYWTYLLPRRVGQEQALHLTTACEPIGTKRSKEIGLIDDWFGETSAAFVRQVEALAETMAHRADYVQLLEAKRAQRQRDESSKPLEAYRDEELAKMWQNFYGEDRSYHLARTSFVRKTVAATPDLVK